MNTKSYLSSQKYGYDFVVATTQASINSGMREYLNNIDQPETNLCFLADQNGNPTVQISLEDLMAKTGGINPFDIPAGTPYDDPRITTLTKNMFVVGLKLKIGLPPGVLPKKLPPIVDLGNSANNVIFNLFCSEFEIIQNNPPSGFGGKGLWNVYSQPSGTPWYFSTKVNLVYEDLNKELNTPYFNNHPKEKAALLAKLKNLGSGAFSLQQLLFDLDNAATMALPKIVGLDPGSNAAVVLTKSFVNLYFASAKVHGEPVLSVKAVANAPDNSSLRLTGLEREVSPMVDGNGVIISNPTPAQKEATTLDYLCATNNNHLPGAATFDWNWVEPADINNYSGIIAINRNTLAKYFKDLLMPHVKQSCLKPTVSTDTGAISASFKSKLTAGQTPTDIQYPATGDTVLKMLYTKNADSNDKWGLTYGEFDIHSSFSCTVSFKNDTITIVQNLKLWLKVQFDATARSGNIVDKTITNSYVLSIDQHGSLITTAQPAVKKDDSQNIDLDGFSNFFVDLNTAIHSVTKWSNSIVETTLKNIPAAEIQNFVFPGAKVFAYKDVKFSEHQDLLTSITYVTPS